MMTAPWPLRGVTDKMIVVHGRCILPLFKSRSKALTFAPRRFFQTARQSLPFVITLQNVPIPRSRHDAVARAKARFCPAFMMLLTRGYSSKQDRVPIQLEKGRNKLLLKVTQCTGDWKFCAHLLGTDGRLLPGIS